MKPMDWMLFLQIALLMFWTAVLVGAVISELRKKR
jgi:hypothetical protein